MTPEQSKQVSAICDEAGIDMIHIRSRERRHWRTRQKISVYLRSQGLSLSEIGDFMFKDHTTILHHLRMKA